MQKRERNNNTNAKRRVAQRVYRPSPANEIGIRTDFRDSIRMRAITQSDGSVQGAAASFVVIDVRLMNPWSGGAAGGTGAFVSSTTGLADATAYSEALVNKLEIDLSGTSLETANINTIGCIFSDTQPSTVVTTFALAKAAQISGKRSSTLVKLGVTSGQPRFRFPLMRTTPKKVLGKRFALAGLNFVTTLNPATALSNQELWLGIIVTAVNAATFLTLGVDISLLVIYYMEAFSRIPGR